MIPGQTARSAAIHASASLPTYLYRCYDADGLLLYVGCTEDPRRRMVHHRNGIGHSVASQLLARYMATSEVDATPYPDRESGRQAEAEAIYAEQPLFNTQGRCLGSSFVQRQIEDYEAGRPIRSWGAFINPSRRVMHVAADHNPHALRKRKRSA